MALAYCLLKRGETHIPSPLLINRSMDSLLRESDVFFLVFIRILSLLSLLPVFSHKAVSIPLRIAFSLVLSVLVVPMVANPAVDTTNVAGYALHAGREVLVGIVLGFACNFIFYGIRFAGGLIGTQMGFGMVNVLDPMSREQGTVIIQVKSVIAMLLFLILDGHFLLIEGIIRSFQAIPLATAVMPKEITQVVIQLSYEVFVIAIKISAPVLVAVVMTNVALGILARTVPQMNVFIIGFPLTIGVGLLTLSITLPMFAGYMTRLIDSLRVTIATLVRLMAG